MILRSSLFLVLCLSLGACASLPPPYVPMPQGSSVEERVLQLQVHGVEGSFMKGYRVDRQSVSLPELAEHLGHSPSPEAVAKAGTWSRYQLAGLATMALSLIPALRTPSDQPLFLTLFAVGLSLPTLGAYFSLEPASTLHNDYLRKDLGLPPDTPVSNPLTGTASAEGLYAIMSIGSRWISNDDLEDYFNDPNAPYASNQWPDERGLGGTFRMGAGMVGRSGLTLEALAGLVDRGEQGKYYTQASGERTPAEVARLVSLSLELSPGMTWQGATLLFDQSSSIFLGWDIGLDVLMARRRREGPLRDYLGDYFLRQPTLGQGPRLRMMIPFNPKLGLGIELGFHWERYYNIHVQDPSGAFAGRPSPDLGLRGNGAVLDYSGPFLNLVLGFGRLPFTR